MSTNIQLITDALRLINVINEIETPSAEQGATCLRILNQLMEQWEEDGINLQYFEQTSTSSDFPGPKYAELGVVAGLAIRAAPFFGASVSPEVANQFTEGMLTITRKSVLKNAQTADLRHMPLGGSRRSASIETDQ